MACIPKSLSSLKSTEIFTSLLHKPLTGNYSLNNLWVCIIVFYDQSFASLQHIYVCGYVSHFGAEDPGSLTGGGQEI